MTNEERIEMLQEAQEKMREAAALINEAIEGLPNKRNIEVYLIPAIVTRIDSDSEWLSKDLTIQNIIDELSEETDDTEDAELVDGFDDQYVFSEDEE